MLKKQWVTATVFVATGAIGADELIWYYRLFDAFRFATVGRTRLADPGVPELYLETIDARMRALQETLVRAKALYGEERQEFIDDLETKLRPEVPADTRQRMLSWDQIKEMHHHGLEFGSHT